MAPDSKTVSIQYGDSLLPTGLDEEQVLFDLQPVDTPPVHDVSQAIRWALQEPIASPSLRQLVNAGDHVVVVGDDITRITPTKHIVPLVLDELNAGGVPDADIVLVIALGTHRSMTSEEIERKYGPRVTDRVRVINHNCFDREALVSCGTTGRGTEVWVSRIVMEADVRVGVGNIVPHHPTGWSAGAKILLPGVAGEQTTAQMHLLGATEQQLGKSNTPCREEMEDFARAIGLHFIVNTVLNREGELAHVVAGDFIEAHREGVRLAKDVFGAPFPQKADVTLSSTYPIDFDLFQADKGLFSAAVSTKEGGEIILLSPCYEGVSPTHPETVNLGCLDDEELWELAESGGDCDPLSIAEALYFNSLKHSFSVTLLTDGISPETAQRMGFGHLRPSELSDYLSDRFKDRPDLTVGIVRQSVETLPLCRLSTAARSEVIPAEGLKLWLAADSGVKEVDGSVLRWEDRSGNGLDATQGSSYSRPKLLPGALNDKPVVHFDGADDFLSFAPLDVNGLTEMTVVLVSANWEHTVSDEWGEEGGPHGTVNACLLFEERDFTDEPWGCVYLSPFQDSVTMRFGTGQADNCERWTRANSIRDAYSTTVALKDGSSETLLVNGEVVASFTGKRKQIANTGNEGWLGRGRLDTSGAFNVAEVLIYDRALSEGELSELHDYLKGKYFSRENG
ncbi:MAG: nickel-dependent lactate racemase [Chloroflexota bacterium]